MYDYLTLDEQTKNLYMEKINKIKKEAEEEVAKAEERALNAKERVKSENQNETYNRMISRGYSDEEARAIAYGEE